MSDNQCEILAQIILSQYRQNPKPDLLDKLIDDNNLRKPEENNNG